MDRNQHLLCKIPCFHGTSVDTPEQSFCSATGAEAEFVQTDVRDEEEVKNLVDKTIARFGRLDIAVNNAGTEGTPGSAADVTTENYQAIFDTKCAWCASEHEVRDSGYAFARQRQHR